MKNGRYSDAQIMADGFPDYELYEDAGDIIRVSRCRLVEDDVPTPRFGSETIDAAREMAPGWDVYALETEWRSFWVASGRQKLRSPDKAYLGGCVAV